MISQDNRIAETRIIKLSKGVRSAFRVKMYGSTWTWDTLLDVCELALTAAILCDRAEREGECVWTEAGLNWEVKCGALPFFTGRPIGQFCPNCGKRIKVSP